MLTGGKFKLNFNPEQYEILEINGPYVLVKNKESRKVLERNIALLKKIPFMDDPKTFLNLK